MRPNRPRFTAGVAAAETDGVPHFLVDVVVVVVVTTRFPDASRVTVTVGAPIRGLAAVGAPPVVTMRFPPDASRVTVTEGVLMRGVEAESGGVGCASGGVALVADEGGGGVGRTWDTEVLDSVLVKFLLPVFDCLRAAGRVGVDDVVVDAVVLAIVLPPPTPDAATESAGFPPEKVV